MPRRMRKLSREIDAEERMRLAIEQIRGKLKHVASCKAKVNHSLFGIQTLIDKNKLSIGSKVNGTLRNKVVNLYTNAKEACSDEENLLRQLLAGIDDVHKVQYEIKRGAQVGRSELMQLLAHHARMAPLWIGPLDTYPPPLVGGIPAPVTMTLKIGCEVGAYVGDIWILAEVTSILANEKYEVKDVDDEPTKKQVVKRKRLIPLPTWRADPLRDSHALFPVNAIVLALYPQTTCFYKGVIDHVPVDAVDDYLVAFEDVSFPQGYSPPLPVAQRYVLNHIVPRKYTKVKRR